MSKTRATAVVRGTCARRPRPLPLYLESLEGRLAPASADLAVTETGPATLVAGASVTYSITLTNNGPDAATGVVLNDSLSFVPSSGVFVPGSFNMSAAAGNPDSFTKTTLPSGFTETANGPIASGDVNVFIVTGGTQSTAPNGSTVTNAENVTSTSTDPNPANNSATVTTTIVQPTDLAVTKTGPSAATAGTNATYTISLTNKGPVNAVNVVLTDTLPVGETLVSETQLTGPDTFTDTSSGNVPSFTAATMGNGNSDTFQVVVSIAGNAAHGSVLTDSAHVAAANPDSTPADDTSSFNTTVASSADLAVTETGPTTLVAGASITYSITLINNGPDAATGVVLTDTLSFVPASGVFIPGSFTLTAAAGNPDSFTYTPAGFSRSETANGPIASGDVNVFILTGGTQSTAPNQSTITDTTTVTSTSADPNPANNSATITTTVVQPTDLAVTKTGPATATAGTNATYTISLTNKGSVSAINVVLTDTLPAGETLISETQLTGPDVFTDTSSGNTASFTATTMGNGNSDTFQVVVFAASSLTSGTTLTDTASVSAANPDPTTGDNTASFNSTVATSADLAVTKSGPANITAGTNATYTISLTNSGPSDARSVSLTDTLPAGETLVSETQLSGPDVFTDTSTGNTASFTAVTMSSGNKDVFRVVAHAASSLASGTILNDTASVSSTTSDPTSVDNTSSVNSAVVTSADLAVTKTGPANISAGANVTYTVSLTNSGPSDARSVSLTDTLPAGETLVSETQLSGPDTFIDVSAGNTASFTAATMSSGNKDVFRVVAHAASGLASGTILTDTASVSSITSDPTLGDNTSSVNSTVATSADVAVTKTGPANVVVGTNLTYTISLTNKGPSDAQSISLTDALPGGLTIISEAQLSGPDAFTNTSSGNTASFSAVSVAAGHSDVFQVVAHAASNLVDATVLSDTATVTSTTSDPNPGNNSSTATTDVVGPPILTVPGAQSVNEDHALVFSNANDNPITVADPDNNGTNPEQLTLTVLNGTLTLGSTAGLTFISGANGTSAMTFTGTLAHLNAALNGLTYSSTNFDGSDVLTITANDLATGQLGGPQQAMATVAVTVNFVNDAPSFTKGPNQSASADSGPQTVLHWATNISPGPGANEAGQTVNFIVSASVPSLFSVQPTIDPSGTLTYTPSPDAEGTAVITVLLHDNGGTANGGIDTSAPQTFTITITPGSRQHTLFATAGGSSSIVFVIGSDGKLYEHVDATGWTAIGAAGTVASISAVTQANGSVVLFAQTTDGGLSFFVAGVGWKGRIGGAGTIAVISAGLDVTGQASVFVIDTNGRLDEWSTSAGWRGIPASPAGAAVQLSAVDNDRVYVVTSNQSVYGHDPNFGWFALTSPSFARSISATDDGQGHVTVYAVTVGEALFRHDDATGWTPIGGTGTIDVVSAGRDRSNQPDVFAITTSSDLAENDTLTGWSLLKPPSAATKISATLADRVFAVLADGSVFGHDDTLGFFPLAGPGFAEV